ncbi:hypothetical protein L7F22_016976 [Adiantum nelumboides]|nr:hypothetical protein [Adiantum nelumboides]
MSLRMPQPPHQAVMQCPPASMSRMPLRATSLQQMVLSMQSLLRRMPVVVVRRRFLDSLADEEALFEVMVAPHYLNILGLEHLTCVRAGERTRDMTPEQARAVFNLASDFTSDEEAATCIRCQKKWAFSLSRT